MHGIIDVNYFQHICFSFSGTFFFLLLLCLGTSKIWYAMVDYTVYFPRLSFALSASKIKEKARVVAMDLRGHGKSTTENETDLSIEVKVQSKEDCSP